MTLTDSVVQWPCGCAGLNIQRGGGDSLVLMACGRHGEDHAHWRDFRHEPCRYVDAGMALCVLDGALGLVRDGWKLRSIRTLLGVSS